MQSELQRGFVLHRRPYSETSLLVDLFTEESGRLTVIAKGHAQSVHLGSRSCNLSHLYCCVGREKHIENPH